jgi:hypothetical protein
MLGVEAGVAADVRQIRVPSKSTSTGVSQSHSQGGVAVGDEDIAVQGEQLQRGRVDAELFQGLATHELQHPQRLAGHAHHGEGGAAPQAEALERRAVETRPRSASSVTSTWLRESERRPVRPTAGSGTARRLNRTSASRCSEFLA